ncbi:unnamed protein product, partial [Pleuronectes platessa]
DQRYAGSNVHPATDESMRRAKETVDAFQPDKSLSGLLTSVDDDVVIAAPAAHKGVAWQRQSPCLQCGTLAVIDKVAAIRAGLHSAPQVKAEMKRSGSEGGGHFGGISLTTKELPSAVMVFSKRDDSFSLILLVSHHLHWVKKVSQD